MRSAIIIACSAVLAASGCSNQLEVVRPALTTTPVHLAMPADTGFVRSTCASPDSVLAGTIPCYQRSQKTHARVF